MGRDAWTEATREATERGLDYIGTDLLLLGLTRVGGVASEVLAEQGATEEVVLRVIADLHRGEEIHEPHEPHPRATPRAEHARGRVEGMAIGLGGPERSIHLLLALAYDRRGIHRGVLSTIGADRRGIVDGLAARGVTVPANPPPPDPTPHSDSVILPDDQARVVAAELARRSLAEPDRFFDEWGDGSFGYGGLPNRPNEARISAEPRIGLRSIVPEILRSAGYPDPPEDAWHTESERTHPP